MMMMIMIIMMIIIVGDMVVDTVEDGAPNIIAKNKVSTILSAGHPPRAIVNPDPNIPACLLIKYYTLFAPVIASLNCNFDIFRTIYHALILYAHYPIFFVVWCIGIPPGVPTPSFTPTCYKHQEQDGYSL